MANNPTSFRLSDEAKLLLNELARRMGGAYRKPSAVVEYAIRVLADREGIKIEDLHVEQAKQRGE